MKFGLLCMFLSVICCEETINSLDEIYRHDLRVVIDGKKFIGIGIIAPKEKYKVEIYPRKSAETLIFSTCHRHEPIEDPDRDFRYIFKPNREMMEHSCLAQIGSFDKKGQHQWAIIDHYGKENLKAKIACNGKITHQIGVSICQAKAGLFQKISFEEPVTVDSVSCKKFESENGLEFQYLIERGFCLYLFRTKDKKMHRHTTLGYTAVLMR